jgi:hypothetical protein
LGRARFEPPNLGFDHRWRAERAGALLDEPRMIALEAREPREEIGKLGVLAVRHEARELCIARRRFAFDRERLGEQLGHRADGRGGRHTGMLAHVAAPGSDLD